MTNHVVAEIGTRLLTFFCPVSVPPCPADSIQPGAQAIHCHRRQRIFGIFVVAGWACLAVLNPSWAQDLSWRPLADGLETSFWDPGMECGDEVSQLIIVKIDPERFRFATYHYLDEKLPAPLTIKEWQRRTGAVVLLNAGLFRDDYSYMGLLLKDGRSVGTKRHPQWQGLFVAEPTLPGLRKARVLDLALDPFTEDHPAYREAAQSLMLLDRSGKPRVRQTGKRAHQTLIAEDQNGHILLIKTADTVALWELAECLRDGLPSIHQVMAMDGGASSDLLIAGHLPIQERSGTTAANLQSLQTLVDGSGMRHIPLPSVIGVLPRRVEALEKK
ncbi:MAG: phosphodiester glycosidase family protein [Nitrospiraceae bacterium]